MLNDVIFSDNIAKKPNIIYTV